MNSHQNDYLCKDVMILSGKDRKVTLALLHAYRKGKKNTTRFRMEALAEAIDGFMDYCLDHPSDKALAAFEKFTK